MGEGKDWENLPRCPDKPSCEATFTYPSSFRWLVALIFSMEATSPCHGVRLYDVILPNLLLCIDRKWIEDLPKHAANLGPGVLALGPLVKTSLMDIVPACSFTPYDFFFPRLKFREANRAVARNFLAFIALAGGVWILRG